MIVPMKCLVDECQLVSWYEFCPVHREETAHECDACGELKHDDAKGEDIIGYITVPGAGRVARDDQWVCSACLFLAEEAEISRAEDRMEGWR